MGAPGIPWRGPGPGRPDLPLPPAPMPLRRDGGLRKRWRYVGLYGEELMLCAARAEVGPLASPSGCSGTASRGEQLAHTSLRPGSREVRHRRRPRRHRRRRPPGRAAPRRRRPDRIDLPERAGLGLDPQGGRGADRRRRSSCRDDASSVERLRRRRRVGRLPGPPHQLALVGRGRHAPSTGAALAWNLVEGINDPPARSERAVWVDGEPHEPAPVRFDGLERSSLDVRFADGASRLAFAAGAERARDENYLLLRSTYRHRFGTFTGCLDGIELAEGLGVMESHDALW